MTAEEFFRKKIKEKCPHQEVVTLANSLITAEDGMRWAYEFSQLAQQETLYTEQQIMEAMLQISEYYANNLGKNIDGYKKSLEIIKSLKQNKKD
jgi:hypothetical protein